MTQKLQKKLQLEVDKFNTKHPIGTKCIIQLDDKSFKEVTVQHEASILGGHTPVGWFEEIRGGYQLSRVQ